MPMCKEVLVYGLQHVKPLASFNFNLIITISPTTLTYISIESFGNGRCA